MFGKRAKILRGISLALALLGVALHVGVLAWHPFARSWTIQAERQLLADLQVAICHNTGLANSADVSENGSTPPAPERKADCLICQGLAHACFAIRATAEFMLIEPAEARFIRPARVSELAGAPLHAPRNRGPPGLA
jgi:hypothetical protein